MCIEEMGEHVMSLNLGMMHLLFDSPLEREPNVPKVGRSATTRCCDSKRFPIAVMDMDVEGIY